MPLRSKYAPRLRQPGVGLFEEAKTVSIRSGEGTRPVFLPWFQGSKGALGFLCGPFKK
jgi:hypothetical protein